MTTYKRATTWSQAISDQDAYRRAGGRARYNVRRQVRALARRPNFKAGELLALFPENPYDIGCGTPAQSNQHQFHGTVGGFFFRGIQNNSVMRCRGSNITLVVRPIY